MFPSYIVYASRKGYPLDEHISITETSAEINLQGVPDRTTERLVEAQCEVL